MIAGCDKYEGFQLYVTDPAGFYSSWKANCIGTNAAAIQTALKAEFTNATNEQKPEVPSTLKEASLLALKVLGKQVEKSAMVGEKLEMMTVEYDGEGKVACQFLAGKQIDLLVSQLEPEAASSPSKPK
jgi:20S proteasome subunit alpha 3